jgi:hypothetical protein
LKWKNSFDDCSSIQKEWTIRTAILKYNLVQNRSVESPQLAPEERASESKLCMTYELKCNFGYWRINRVRTDILDTHPFWEKLSNTLLPISSPTLWEIVCFAENFEILTIESRTGVADAETFAHGSELNFRPCESMQMSRCLIRKWRAAAWHRHW